MPDVAGPFDGATYGQGPWFRDRGWEPAGVRGMPVATPAAGELGLTAAGFGLTLGLGRARVRGASYERTGTAWTYTVPANTATVGPRNDLLVLRRDLVAKTVVPTYLQGTAAATPTDPAVTQVEDGVWDETLFRVQAPASSGTPLVISDLRRWAHDGVTDTGWQPVTPAAGWSAGSAIRGRVVGGVAHVALNMLATGGIVANFVVVDLPAWLVPTTLPFGSFLGTHNANALAVMSMTAAGRITVLTAAAGNNGLYALLTYPLG